MSAGYLELFLEQGEDYSISITLDGLNGYPYNLVGSNVKSDIKKSYWSANTSASFSANIANTELGIITLSLSANSTQNLNPGRYVYDVFVTNEETNPTNRSKVLEGIINVEPSATRI